ncbi:helix-turn-helix domain-containing protein [Streptococcus hyointestinalis]|uniref:Rgg/GadR/MutR family transcriptional regulator n=1 Tax=Streptococcus hyointestinalis TaxID=1337 RepID=UPI0023F7FDBD|nr:Rgg/GadR/MutR family transcriptional regulator [Streptococcus hyointestinalis]
MDDSYGKVFKMIRESKNMSLKEVAGDFVTPAQLSRFENGKSNLSVDTFFYCLRRMDVLQGEFSTFYSAYFQNQDVRLSPQLLKAIQSRNIGYLDKQIKEYQERFAEEGRKSDRVLIAVFHVMINRCDPKQGVPETERQVIADYLMSVDEWCFYELWILGYCARSLNTKLLELLSSELLNRTQFFNGITENRKRVYKVLLNIVGHLLDRKEDRTAARLINSLDSLDILEADLYERLQLKFAKGHLNYLQGNIKGLETMKKCQEMANFLDCYDLSQQIEDTFAQFTDM